MGIPAGIVDGDKFDQCLDNGKHTDKVNESIQEAIAANGGPSGLGTPFTLVIVGGELVVKGRSEQTPPPETLAVVEKESR